MQKFIDDPSLKNHDFENADLAELFGEMKNIPSPLRNGWLQKRGFGLERLLHEVLLRESLAPRKSYAPKGEQIDGAFLLDNTHYIFEAKWTGSPISGPTVVAFKSKIEKRLSGTLGIFFSANGFVDDIVNYVSSGSWLNVLLIDGDDIAYGLRNGFTAMLREKVKMAAQDGLIYYQIEKFEEAIRSANRDVNGPSLSKTFAESLVVVTEGPWDAKAVGEIVKLTETTYGIQLTVTSAPAYGVMQAFSMAAALHARVQFNERVIVLVDGDGNSPEEVRDQWGNEFSPGIEVIVADPTLESWFVSEETRSTYGPYGERLLENIKNIDINVLREERLDFNEFIKAITKKNNDS